MGLFLMKSKPCILHYTRTMVNTPLKSALGTVLDRLLKCTRDMEGDVPMRREHLR